MPISVKFLAILKVQAGTDSYILQDTKIHTLREVLHIVDQQFFLGSNLIFETNSTHINPALLIMVDGQDYRLLDGEIESSIDGSEEITLLSSLHGG
ncbi:MAG: hypothetical protein RBG13Loki_1904 [Promethearchaeota archaeon CR_4]|nr:MAG: hypothetical protein RBG13Loki_1904 [Candidatus Lokiarchaeota archaeon CR_4]